MSNVDVLRQALENASLSRDPKSPIRSRNTSRRGRPRQELEGESDDDAPAGIETPMTTPGTPRSTSPTRSGSRMAERRRQRELEAATSHDPLRRLPHELSSRIFLELGIGELARCARVCKRWRKSQTLNYCWFVMHQQHTFRDAPAVSPVWSKKDAKQDWSARYKSSFRRDELEHASAADADFERARSEGYRTPREEREQRWADESAETNSVSKSEQREYYKSLKNAKGAKAGRGGPRDRTEAWDD